MAVVVLVEEKNKRRDLKDFELIKARSEGFKEHLIQIWGFRIRYVEHQKLEPFVQVVPICSRLLNQGAHLICYPGAFNMTTGPLHWELLQRASWVALGCFVWVEGKHWDMLWNLIRNCGALFANVYAADMWMAAVFCRWWSCLAYRWYVALLWLYGLRLGSGGGLSSVSKWLMVAIVFCLNGGGCCVLLMSCLAKEFRIVIFGV
ncbi:hypothetical protein LOK49_LG12G00901 [Camellia lanceoleosa]|uniref:Uncharacterized protein n=1 Tax=Camellia lanceoleosa TaxID=1840588 RepID=A0ACC0FTY0_9ERIC|nr:hypothetical protein LOK49_LG12G00901 [Camellia lanceoleosa]